ncbi:hypothetical protein C8R46DRAFT_1318082 [Mycena filopes]|nr:hypothetical protein C8R46DRAFT_1318082 [Mycena filopes]
MRYVSFTLFFGLCAAVRHTPLPRDPSSHSSSTSPLNSIIPQIREEIGAAGGDEARRGLDDEDVQNIEDGLVNSEQDLLHSALLSILAGEIATGGLGQGSLNIITFESNSTVLTHLLHPPPPPSSTSTVLTHLLHPPPSPSSTPPTPPLPPSGPSTELDRPSVSPSSIVETTVPSAPSQSGGPTSIPLSTPAVLIPNASSPGPTINGPTPATISGLTASATSASTSTAFARLKHRDVMLLGILLPLFAIAIAVTIGIFRWRRRRRRRDRHRRPQVFTGRHDDLAAGDIERELGLTADQRQKGSEPDSISAADRSYTRGAGSAVPGAATLFRFPSSTANPTFEEPPPPYAPAPSRPRGLKSLNILFPPGISQ